MNGELPYERGYVFPWQALTLIGLVLAITSMVGIFGVTVNQTVAAVFSMIVLTIWYYDRFSGIVSGILFFLTKSFWVRLAFGFDFNMSGSGGFDLLGITPALLLAGLTVLELYGRIARGQKICPDKTRRLLLAFAFLCFLSILNPASSPIIGLAGLERNIIPNMTMLFLLSSVVIDRMQVIRLVKVLLILGVISCAYGIGQYFAGLYPWELDSFRQMAFDEGLSGWLTIGMRGIEFRVFSIFYGYMDFFFTNILIFALAMSYREDLSGRWKRLRILYFILWTITLLLSLERMPLIMTLVIIIVLRLLGSSAAKRRRLIWRSVVIGTIMYGSLLIAGPYLESTGADKLVRLSEMADPFEATSINDRAENKWGPALETIMENPLGVGIGYGSQTKAKEEAAKSGLFVQPHNELIQKTLETGFIGGLLYFLLLISIFRDFLKMNMADSSNRAFAFAMIAGTISFWLCGMVNLPFCGASGLVYWSLAGAAIAIKDFSNFAEKVANQNLETADKVKDKLMHYETCARGTKAMDNE
jgi:O-antigen ligase